MGSKSGILPGDTACLLDTDHSSRQLGFLARWSRHETNIISAPEAVAVTTDSRRWLRLAGLRVALVPRAVTLDMASTESRDYLLLPIAVGVNVDAARTSIIMQPPRLSCRVRD